MNCKPGDLAIIVADGQGGESMAIGLIVEVIEPARCQFGPGWKVKMQSVRGIELPSGKVIYSDWFLAADMFLRPVSGLPIDDEVTNDLEVPA